MIQINLRGNGEARRFTCYSGAAHGAESNTYPNAADRSIARSHVCKILINLKLVRLRIPGYDHEAGSSNLSGRTIHSITCAAHFLTTVPFKGTCAIQMRWAHQRVYLRGRQGFWGSHGSHGSESSLQFDSGARSADGESREGTRLDRDQRYPGAEQDLEIILLHGASAYQNRNSN